MPYINQEAKDRIKTNVLSIATPGELNYLVTLTIIDTFRKHPKYETIHALKLDFVIAPKRNKFLRYLVSHLAGNFTTDDVYTAAALAYDEFSRLVVSRYEDVKIQLNGHVKEYVDLLQAIDDLRPKAEAK